MIRIPKPCDIAPSVWQWLQDKGIPAESIPVVFALEEAARLRSFDGVVFVVAGWKIAKDLSSLCMDAARRITTLFSKPVERIVVGWEDSHPQELQDQQLMLEPCPESFTPVAVWLSPACIERLCGFSYKPYLVDYSEKVYRIGVKDKSDILRSIAWPDV